MLLTLPRSEVLRLPSADRTVEELYQQKNHLHYRRNQEIPLLQQDILIVQQGIVQISTFDADGNVVLLALASASMPFGLPLTFIDPYFATALTNVSLMRFTVAEIDQHVALNRLVLRGIDRRLQQSEAIQLILGNRHIQERLHQFLLLLSREIGEPVADGIRLTARLTHQHLASTIGTTRVTVTRTLSRMQDSGLIRFDKTRHMVVSMPFNKLICPVKSPVAIAN
jgi:CRP-like cAMP-binding protein